MKFYNLPSDIIKLIFYFRIHLTACNKVSKYIQSHWIGYRIRILLA